MAEYYRIVNTDGRTSIAFSNKGSYMSVDDEHPDFEAIRESLLEGDHESAAEMYDAALAISTRFNKVTDRVSIKGSSLFFDNELIENDLTEKILSYYRSGEDFVPLVNFLEKLYVNSNEYIRRQLFRFIERRNLTILPNGDFIGHKGVLSAGNGKFQSRNSGHAIVNGVDHNGRIPQGIGDVVEMPRSEVTFDELQHCSAGLHVGTWRYASAWGDGSTLLVAVNPRDVVSVPADGAGDKLRTCRYRVLDTTEAEVTGTLNTSYNDLLEDDGAFSVTSDLEGEEDDIYDDLFDEDTCDDSWDEDWDDDDEPVSYHAGGIVTPPTPTAWGGVEIKRGLGLKSRKTGRTALRVDRVNTDGTVRVYDIGDGKYRDGLAVRGLVKSYYA